MADNNYYRPYLDDDEAESEFEKEEVLDADGDEDQPTLEEAEEARLAAEEQDLEDEEAEGDLAEIFDAMNRPDFSAFARAIRYMTAAGPAFPKMNQQLRYGRNRIGRRTAYSAIDEAFVESDTVKALPQYGKTSAEVKEIDNNPILIDSKKRFLPLYAQPTFFSTRLPRVYRNITSLNFAQINFLNRLYYFRPSKNNTSIDIQEFDRSTFTTTLRQGSYSITGLKNELETQLNRTPLFYDFATSNFFDYQGAYDRFNEAFSGTRNFYLNFNPPGSNFYDNRTNSFLSNPTSNDILMSFWAGNSTNLGTDPNNDQIYLAYYYPVLKEQLTDEFYRGTPLNLTIGIGIDPSITDVSGVYQRCVFGFEGLNKNGTGAVDPVVYAVTNDASNRAALDAYRLAHTFRYSLVNAYSMTINSQDSTVTIATNSLNRSLATLINTQGNIILADLLSNAGLTPSSYSNIKANLKLQDYILADMYNYTQVTYADNFAIPYSTYSRGYYAALTNTIKLRNGLAAFGIPQTAAQAAAAGITTISSNILAPIQEEPIIRWPHLSNLDISNVYMTNLSNAPRGDMNHPYSVDLGTIDEAATVIDVSGPTPTYYIQPNAISKKVDCIVPINAGQYTTFKFHSPVRQTLQVETLPRPLQYRYPDYNLANYDSTINKYFQESYTYDVSSNSYSAGALYTYGYDNLNSNYLSNIPSWSNASTDRWLTGYSTSKDFYSNAVFLQATSFGTNPPWNGLFYKFTTPDVSGADPSKAYRYPLNLTTEIYTDQSGTTLTAAPSTFRTFLYSDRGGFQADLYMSTAFGGLVPAFTNFRSEDPINFKYSTVIESTDTSGTIQFNAYPGQTYYVSCRGDNAASGSIYTKIFPWFSANASTNTITMDRTIGGMNPATDAIDLSAVYLSNYNYASVYDYAALALPNTSTLWGINPDLNAASFEVDISATPIGYDVSGVSNDYLDYVPYNPYVSTFTFQSDPLKAIVGFDPINRYLFQSNSPYNTSNDTYFYGGSSNAIYTPAAAFAYTPKAVAKRQDKIVHYYSPTYITQPENAIESGLYSNVRSLVTEGPAQKPYTSTSTGGPIPGYQYDSSGHINLNFGTTGFTFAPKSGLWNVESLQVRSALYTSNAVNDPNSEVKYVGIFQTADINDIQNINWTMSTAVTLLSNSGRAAYPPRTSNYDITTVGDIQDSGFDTRGATYYEYKKDPSFIPQIRTSTLQGYTQVEGTITNNPANLYSAIFLNSNYQPTTFKALSGSVVPYPFYSQISTGYTYMDTDTASPNTIPQRAVAYASTPITNLAQTEWNFLNLTDISNGIHGPTVTGITVSQSAYAQSMPIGTSVLHTQRQNDPFTDLSGIYSWATPIQPSAAYMRCASTVMFQASDFFIYSFNQLSTSYDISAGALLYTITESSIFDTLTTGIALVGADSTTTEYAFMGWRPGGAGTEVYFKRFDPALNSMYDYTPTSTLDIAFTTPVFNSFTLNNQGDITYSVHDPSGNQSYIYRYTAASGLWTTTASTIGKRWIHDQDPSGGSHFYALEVDAASGKGNFLRYYRESLTDVSGFTLIPTTGPVPPYPIAAPTYSGIMINDLGGQQFEDPVLVVDDIILYSTDATFQDRIYQVRALQNGDTEMTVEPLATTIADASGPLTVVSVAGGYDAGFWLLTNRAPQTLWGNRNNPLDLKYRIDSEWQIFYPYQKIVLTQSGVSLNPIVDTTDLLPGEYLHTNLFYYPTEAAYRADVSGQWGLERFGNFAVADVNYRGYLFNSYVFDVPLQPSSGSAYQFITVRGYSPTESGECLMRFSCTNLYDFGYATFVDVSNEIQVYKTNPTLFDPDYAACLTNFKNQYIATTNRRWGAVPAAGFIGSNYSTSNYGGFISTYSTLYHIYESTSVVINNIDNELFARLSTFIGTDLRYILPASAAQRQNFTDALSFRIPWFSSLPDNFKPLKDNWGLGYNLGYNKVDTGYALYHRSQNGYRILADYIYLQLNQEEDMNRLDTIEEELDNNNTVTTGQTNKYYGKLLLNDFNANCTTMVQNSVKFSPPLARLDKLTFQWVDEGGVVIDSVDSEWTATAVITERRTVQIQNINGSV
jgi:hypothetical protein